MNMPSIVLSIPRKLLQEQRASLFYLTGYVSTKCFRVRIRLFRFARGQP
jgi:hypothetical protein